ncbi:MAG: methyl-accepting chemotaxis protein, partial [Gammaproteobacteria bacterium]|nr:methyl-accepting chemotaxis protein [Gammaproteobacteria bacterium]
MANTTPGKKLLSILGGLLLVLLALAAASVYLGQRGGQGQQAGVEYLLEREALSGIAARKAQQAVGGDPAALNDLRDVLARVESVKPIAIGGAAANQIERSWEQLTTDIRAVLAGHESIGIVQRASTSISLETPSLLTEVGNLAAMPGQAQLIREMQRFELSTQQLQQDAAALASARGAPAEVARRLASTDEFLSQFIRALSQGDATLGIARVTGADAQAKVAEIKTIFDRISATTRESVVTAESFGQMVQHADAVAANSDALLADSASLRNEIKASSPITIPPLVPLALIAAALLTFLLMALLTRRAAGAQREAFFEAEQSTKNQDAILRLLDELGSLADGDLTVQATVSEDITGAIADSINYAIEALRDLVTTIDEAASQVDEAARQTQASAAHLAQASENQSGQVKAATKSISDMAESIEEVSHNAERSSEVARHSVEIA